MQTRNGTHRTIAYKGWNDSRNRGDKAVVLANGSYLKVEWVEHAAEVMEQISVSIPWQRGDVMVLDNNLVMYSIQNTSSTEPAKTITRHSRRSFTGPRTVLASLARKN